MFLSQYAMAFPPQPNGLPGVSSPPWDLSRSVSRIKPFSLFPSKLPEYADDRAPADDCEITDEELFGLISFAVVKTAFLADARARSYEIE